MMPFGGQETVGSPKSKLIEGAEKGSKGRRKAERERERERERENGGIVVNGGRLEGAERSGEPSSFYGRPSFAPEILLQPC